LAGLTGQSPEGRAGGFVAWAGDTGRACGAVALLVLLRLGAVL
jgi:hypothetical protein